MPDRIAPAVSDADQTNELPSADQTVTDFVPVRIPAIAAEVEVDLEDLSADAVIDGTQEIGGADILEVEQIAAKLDADEKLEVSMDARNKELSEVFGALSLRKPQKTLVGVGIPRSVPRPPPPNVDTRSLPVMLPPSGPVETIDTLPILVPTFRPPQPSFAPLPPPRSPSRHPSPPSHYPSRHPSSISPLALDIGLEAAPIESTVHVRRPSKIPGRARPELAIVAGIAAWTVMAASVALVLGGTFLGIRHHAASKASAAAVLASPRAPVVEVAPEVPAPPPVEQAAPVAVVEKPAAPAPVPIALPQPRHAATPPRTPTKPAAGIVGAQTGVLRVPGGVKGVLVDGAPHKVEGGALFLPCGKHSIKAPGHPARSVDIVCGKTVTL
ncbi:MAG: hypothetical protein ABIP89_04335 [Polyangiaceae bacterium]